MEKRTVGRNVEAIVDGHMLTLVIDLSQSIGPSKSGKNTLIASTSGNFTLPSGEKVGVNVFRAVPNSRQLPTPHAIRADTGNPH